MADFIKAYHNTAANEGGYSNDPNDAGGETWRGIARNKNPDWSGWAIVDLYRHDITFPGCLGADVKLQGLVLSFYQANYWDSIRGDELAVQDVANSIYDSAVNMGVTVAIKLAQRPYGLKETGVINNAFLKQLNNGK